jgi:hypothetical protein
MQKKTLVPLVAIVVVALVLVSIIPIVLWAHSNASSSLPQRSSTSIVNHSQAGQTSAITGKVTATAGTTTATGTASTGTKTPSTAHPTPVLSPTSPTHQGKATVYLQGPYNSSNPVYYGVPIWIDGRAFQPGEPVTLYWNYQQPGQFAVTTVTALNDGSFQYKTTTPGDPNLGTVRVAAIGTVSHLLAVTSTTEPADVLPNPFNAMVGSTVQVIGGGFDSNERITLLLQGNVLTTVTASGLGSFSATFTISNTASPGKASLQAIGQSSGLHISAASFWISLPVALSPASGTAGTKVTISGSHFTPSGQIIINWNNYSGPGSNYTVATVTATTSGTFSAVVAVPVCQSQGSGTICAFDIYDVQTRADVVIEFPEQ